MFLHTWAGIGGAETLMLELVRRMDRAASPRNCAASRIWAIGQMLAREIPTHQRLLSHKYDLRVLPRLSASSPGGGSMR